MAKKKVSKARRKSDKKSSQRFLWDDFHHIGKLDLIALVLLLIAVGGVYFGSVDREFVHWDDNEYVFENAMVMDEASTVSDFFDADLLGLISVATGAKDREEVNTRAVVVANYHPITMLTLHWNWQSTEGAFAPFYRTNVWLHLLNSLLVYLLIVRLYPSRWVGLFTALIFAVHPLHVESVAWISERKDVLYTAFFLTGLLGYWEYLQRKQWYWLAIAFLAMGLSCLSKPAAVVFPLVMTLFVFVKSDEKGIKKYLHTTPFYALALFFGLLTLGAQSEAINDSDSFTFFDRLTLGFWANARYIFRFFFPGNHATMHPIPSEIRSVFYSGWAAMLGFVAVAIWSWKTGRKIILMGLLFYIATIVLVLQFLGVGSAIISERYTYLPYVGLCLALLALIHKWLKASGGVLKGRGILITGVFSAVVLIFGSLSQVQAKVWVNSDRLWSQVIERYPNAYLGYKSRGYYFSVLAKEQSNSDLFQRAITDYDLALERTTKSDDLSEVHTIRGYALFALGRDVEAVAAYDRALALDPKNDQARSNRGVALVRLKRYNEAFPELNATVDNPEYRAQSLKARSVASFYTRDYAATIADVDEYLRLNPNEYDMMNQKAVSCINLGQYQEAVETLSQAIQLAGSTHPSIKQFYKNRGLAFELLGDQERAAQDRRMAQ